MTSLQQPKFIQIIGRGEEVTALDEEGNVWYYNPYGDNKGWYPLLTVRYATPE